MRIINNASAGSQINLLCLIYRVLRRAKTNKSIDAQIASLIEEAENTEDIDRREDIYQEVDKLIYDIKEFLKEDNNQNDFKELAQYGVGETGAPSFDSMLRSHVQFPKPLIVAVRGLAIGWGATLLGTVDLVVMSTTARIRLPFTALGLAPEAGSSQTFPALMKQDGVWLLYSSEYMTASECKRLGLAFKVTADFYLMNEAYRLCGILAKQPIASLIATKKLIVQGKADAILEAHKREQVAFASGLLGGAANKEALLALKEKRLPDFSKL